MLKADKMHDHLRKFARLLTGDGAAAMLRLREAADALEVKLPDSVWPLPKYREMLFPV